MRVPPIHHSVLRRRAAVVAAGATAVAAGLIGTLPLAASAAPAQSSGAGIRWVRSWETQLSANDSSSSPIPITIGKTKAFVVGVADISTGTEGRLYAVSLRTGRTVPGWPIGTPSNIGIESTPSVWGNDVFVGVGNAADNSGGYWAINARGHRQLWFKSAPTSPYTTGKAGVQGGLAVGVLDGHVSVAAGTLGQYFDARVAADGDNVVGFPWLSTDTEFSTPAIANLYGNGKNYIISGAEQTAGSHESQGGHLWVIDQNGTHGGGTANPHAKGANCADSTFNQGVMSSPAVGRFLSKKGVGIAVGTGYDFHSATGLPSDSYRIYALNSHCGVAWNDTLDGVTLSSPALVDALGNGNLQVAEGTTRGIFPGNGSAASGTAYLMNGSNGATIWKHNLPSPIIGGITSANLGGGHQDLLVPTTNGLYILNGKNGAQVGYLGSHIDMQNSALVTDNSNGTIGITIVGNDAHGTVAAHFDISGTKGNLADEGGAWPMFHHDAQLTGSTLPRVKK